MITCTRYHDISCGHRVAGHTGKCSTLHGHNYRIHFTCQADNVDNLGMVVDFSFIKSEMCQWLEDEWDHRMLIWEDDKLMAEWHLPGIYLVPFNPTAENMARFLLEKKWTLPDGVTLVRVLVEETRKCSAEASR